MRFIGIVTERAGDLYFGAGKMGVSKTGEEEEEKTLYWWLVLFHVVVASTTSRSSFRVFVEVLYRDQTNSMAKETTIFCLLSHTSKKRKETRVCKNGYLAF